MFAPGNTAHFIFAMPHLEYDFQVLALQGTEAISQPYCFELDLPTSAQWEFVGRNRGSKEWIFSTHDGKSPHFYYEQTGQPRQGGKFVPIGSRLPPNPLGVHDMADNGKEWVNDWFSDTWYRDNPKVTDPQGPVDGTEKVVRNLDFSFSRIGTPETISTMLSGDRIHIAQFTFRCALQSSAPMRQVEL